MSPRVRFTSDPEASVAKNWLIKGVLAADEVSLTLAPPFAGKSALAGDIAATIGIGEAWFGHQTTKAATLYIAQERSAVMFRRLRAFEVYHEVKDLPVGLLMERLDLVNEGKAGAQLIAEAARSCEDRTGLQLGLITLDTVASLSPGSDENSPKDMGKFLDAVARVRDRLGGGVHVNLVHHTPQDDARKSRGHTSLPGMVDTIILVSAKGKDRTWQISQANDLIAMPAPAPFELRSVNIGRDVSAPIVLPVIAEEKTASSAPQRERLSPDGQTGLSIVRSLTNGEPLTVDRFREAFKVHPEFKNREKDTQRRAFKTVRDQLSATHHIAIVDNVITVNSEMGP